MQSKSTVERIVRAAFYLLIFLILGAVSVRAQTCRDPYIFLVIPDKKGNIIDPATLEEPKSEAKNIRAFSYFDGGNIAKPIKALEVDGNGSCSIKMDTLTIKHQGKTMRLVFNLIYYTYNPPRDRGDAQLIYETFAAIKLPPVQNGTFEYVVPDYNKSILPDWKKLSDKILTGEEIKAARTARKQN